jgi:hypothetical protein
LPTSSSQANLTPCTEGVKDSDPRPRRIAEQRFTVADAISPAAIDFAGWW